MSRRFSWPTRSGIRESIAQIRRSTSGPTVVLAGVVPEVLQRLEESAFAKATTDRSAIAGRQSQIVLRFRKDLRCPLTIRPRPASEVGDDRLAAALGALSIDPGVPWVVVDAGTALTVNGISPATRSRKGKIAGVFEGGLIVPGEGLSLRALGEAAQLPALRPRTGARKVPCWGRSTEEAIRFGVRRAQVATAIELIRAQAKALGPKTRVALTGGGCGVIWPGVRKALKSYRPIRDPDLVHRGLVAALDFGQSRTD